MKRLKMFGKNSVSTLIFWLVILCLLFVLILFFRFLPELIQNENIPFVLNMLPMIGYLALLIPLALILNTFRKEKIFTKQSIKYLNLFALVNFIVPIFYALSGVLIHNLKLTETISGLLLHIILAVFALFIASIFKQGFQIQQENNLTI